MIRMTTYKLAVFMLFVGTAGLMFFDRSDFPDLVGRHVFSGQGVELRAIFATVYLVVGALTALSIGWTGWTRWVFTAGLVVALCWAMFMIVMSAFYDGNAEDALLWLFFCTVHMRSILYWESRLVVHQHAKEIEARLHKLSEE